MILYLSAPPLPDLSPENTPSSPLHSCVSCTIVELLRRKGAAKDGTFNRLGNNRECLRCRDISDLVYYFLMTERTMNRIYQGRVTKVELPDGKDEKGHQKWKPLDDWQAALWRHHELFQDAVNYYTLALAAMAAGVEGKSDQVKALSQWVAKVKETWRDARKKAQKFDGPEKRLGTILKLDPGTSDFDKSTRRILRSSRATPKQRAAALVQLLSEKGDLNQICVERLPWFASPAGKCAATSKASSSTQAVKRQQVIRQYHQFAKREALKKAPSLDLGLFMTQSPSEHAKGADALQMLRNYFAKTKAKHPELEIVAKAFEKHISGLSGTLKVPLPGRKPSGLYPVAAVFKYFPRQETLAAFLKATQSTSEAKDKERVSDEIASSRIADQPHFDYFTNIALIANGADEKQDTRAVWFEFDLAAFIEAIKAPRRYYEDTLTREASAVRLRQQIAAMDGKGREVSDEEAEGDSLPGFEDDARIKLIKTIVQKKLAWLAETEGDEQAKGPKEYTIRERTVRGFGEVKRRWLNEAEKGKAMEERLLEILAKEQTAHREDFGSSVLYRELTRLEFHPIWRDGGTKPWHAEDPLAAWLDYKGLQSELQDKERPIRFTPAHPKHSPRYFIFPKRSETQPKSRSPRPPKPGLLSRHEAGQLSFTAGLVLPAERGHTPSVVRIYYAAPRLCRDNIRTSGDSNLYETPWLQPMMAALGIEKSPALVNFANCRITLQPETPDNIQLTFPVEVSPDKIKDRLAREGVWEKQFTQSGEATGYAPMTLRWPHEKQLAKPPVPWHEQAGSFRCLATDLGQRDAGAFARLVARNDGKVGLNKRGRPVPSLFIGETGDKQWRAAVERTGLFRLPGEDAEVWRKKTEHDARNAEDSGKPFDFREELWGERGRRARPWEKDDTDELMRLLEVPVEDKDHSLLPEDWREALTFPEQNDKLLVAARRYQSRMARLHRWCWFLRGDERQQDTARSEVADCDDPRLMTSELKQLTERRDPRVLALLEAQLQQRLELAPRLLVRIANRILPLRGCSWQWEKHTHATAENLLHHLTQNGPNLDSAEKPVWIRGQRGLSMKRIEQIEELRKRLQSLNQTMRRKIGGKPPIRRDESVPDPCPDLLEKLDHIKKQRVNQTAHMILAEALGLRLAPPPADKKKLRTEKDQHGVYEKIPGRDGKWIGPVDFIAIEDLSRYRASQGRASRENSRLMKWCHRAVRDKLKQLREVFGLPVLETPAAYSSRFCSRSGVPGFRATEVTAGFIKAGQWAWLAGKKDDKGNPTEEAQRLIDLDRKLTESQKSLERRWIAKKRLAPCPKRTLFVPMAGGPVFVPVVDKVEGVDLQPGVVQADINAAINLGLRAIADPKLWNIHPRLRTQRNAKDQSLAAREKRKFGEKNPPKLVISQPASPAKDVTRQPNFFADFAGLKALADYLVNKNPHDFIWLKKEWTSAELSGDNNTPPLIHSKSFWGCVKAAQWDRINSINEARFTEWS